MGQYPYISNEEIDVVTTQILNNAGIATEWNGSVQRVDIDSLIEFDFGLDIIWKDIDYLAPIGEEVLAAIYPKNRAIYMNETKKDLFEKIIGTLNFSKAHELGHWVLHVTEQKNYNQLSFTEHDQFFCRNMGKKPREETQADMFAASLLMPSKILSGAINVIYEDHFPTFPDLYQLKDIFEVSISALTIRLNRLGILYIGDDHKIYRSEDEYNGQTSLV